jgi:hypothetical protein
MSQIHALNHQKGWRKGTSGQSFDESHLKVGEKLIKQTEGSDTHSGCLTGGRGQTASAIILEMMEAQQGPQQVYKSTHLNLCRCGNELGSIQANSTSQEISPFCVVLNKKISHSQYT